jgi:hypothetical protein
MNTELRYRTFDDLLNEVGTDFVMYNNENLIEPAQLIKVAQKVNYDLGLRIHGTKEKVLEVEKGKAKLPDDFYVLNYAFLCGEETITRAVPSGRQTENVIVDDCNRCGAPHGQCGCEMTYAVECKTGEKIFVQVVEKKKFETRTYTTVERIGISPSSGKWDALDNRVKSAYIKNGFIYVNFGEWYEDAPEYTDYPAYGIVRSVNRKIYISYEGALEDDEGNLLVLDHPMINEYYEYAMKQRILENLYINGEDVAQKLQLIEQRLRPARNNALTIVNTPNFAEMYTLWRTNRKAMYARYYDMFKSIDGAL